MTSPLVEYQNGTRKPSKSNGPPDTPREYRSSARAKRANKNVDVSPRDL